MKTLFRLLFTTMFLFTAAQLSIAQKKGDISVGAGIGYGLDVEEIGIQLNGYYSLTENMRVGADFNYWLIGGNEIADQTMWELNGDFHFLFFNNNSFVFYGLGSLGYHYYKSDSFLGEISGSEIGLGFGAGIEYDFGGLKVYLEPRYFLTGFEQFEINAGLRIPF